MYAKILKQKNASNIQNSNLLRADVEITLLQDNVASGIWQHGEKQQYPNFMHGLTLYRPTF